MSFLNSEMALSVLQMVEMQVKAYQKFMELLGDKEEARQQTEIFMKAMKGLGNKPKTDKVTINTNGFQVMGENKARRIAEEEL